MLKDICHKRPRLRKIGNDKLLTIAILIQKTRLNIAGLLKDSDYASLQ